MNRSLLAGIFFIIFYIPVMSQLDPDSVDKNNIRRNIDSLQSVFKCTCLEDEYAKEDTTFIRNLCFLSDKYAHYWPDSALICARQAIRLAEKLKHQYSLMIGFRVLGTIFCENKKYDSSSYYYNKGLGISIANNFYYQELNYFRMPLNNNYFLLGDYSGAMNISTGGLATAERINDKDKMEHFNNVLGYIMMKLQNYELSRNYYSTSLELSREMNDKIRLAHSWLNLADLSIAEKKMLEAVSFINNALDIYQAIPDKFPENGVKFEREAYTYNKLAEVYKLMQKSKEALVRSLEAIEIVKINHIGNEYDVADYYVDAGDIYNRLQKPDSALFYLRQGQTIAQRIIYKEGIRDVYEQLSISFAMKNVFDSAFIYQRSFTQLKDSILNEASQKEIANLQIERLSRIQQAELAHQELWRNIIIGIFIFTLLIVVMLYNRYRIKQQVIYQEQLNKQQNEMFNLTSSVQEKERKRIAEDLHDGLGSVLSAAKLKLSGLEEDKGPLSEDQRKRYNETLSLLDEAAAELRNISHNIMPATLSKLGLVAALKNLTDRISSHSGLQVQYETHGFDDRLEESVEISIYRIVLELLNNIVKHAHASRTIVQLIKYPDYINITTDDNGKGFDYKEVMKKNVGIGLGNIESRVIFLGGTIDIDSVSERGTVTIIDIPYTSSPIKYQDIGIQNE